MFFICTINNSVYYCGIVMFCNTRERERERERETENSQFCNDKTHYVVTVLSSSIYDDPNSNNGGPWLVPNM